MVDVSPQLSSWTAIRKPLYGPPLSRLVDRFRGPRTGPRPPRSPTQRPIGGTCAVPAPARPMPETGGRRAALPRFERRGEVLVRREPDAIVEAPTGFSEVERRDRLYRRSLVASDLVSFALALVLAISVLGDDDILAPISFLVLPLVVLAAKVQGLYDRDELLMRKTTLDEAPQLFGLATLCTLGFWLLHNAAMSGYLGNKQILLLWGSLLTLSLVGRALARTAARRVAPSERCLFIGDARA